MSSFSPNPDSSVARTGVTTTGQGASASAMAAATLWPATAAVPWPMTRIRVMAPDASRDRTASGRVSSPRRDDELAAALVGFDLAPQGLAEGLRRLGDLLQQEMGEAGPVDVPGGDLRRAQLGKLDGKVRAVVRRATDTVEGPGPGPGQGDDLAVGGLAVHPQVGRGLLDQAVGLAGHDKGILGEPDVERLSAALEGQVDVVGGLSGADADGHRPLEAATPSTRRRRRARPLRPGAATPEPGSPWHRSSARSGGAGSPENGAPGGCRRRR